MKRLQRILHVDDAADIRLVTRVALERIGGYRVLSCDSGEQALAQIAPFAPDLILLDAMLPGMDGREILRQLGARRDLGHLPVVFLTGHPEPERHAELLALGACAVLVKPFDPRQLPAQLEAIWRHGNPESASET